jgi:hypothetical protein
VPWEFAIRITLITALASTTSAIALLNITIYLIFPPDAVETIQWNIAPAPSAILAMTILAGAILIITLCVLFGLWAKNSKSAPSKRTGIQSADYFAEPPV